MQQYMVVLAPLKLGVLFGALYASGGEGASFNSVDYGQIPGDPPSGDPANQGGALRSQDLATSGDPVGLNGAVIRIDPATGAALPDNPRASNPDPNAQRIIAEGLRNPFRFTVRPGTNELWVGDVGWNQWEEINRIASGGDGVTENFGWPCYEGSARQNGYDGLNLSICEARTRSCWRRHGALLHLPPRRDGRDRRGLPHRLGIHHRPGLLHRRHVPHSLQRGALLR